MRGLRAVVRLGRLAEGALAKLATDGEFDRRAAWLDREKYGRRYVLRHSRFPRMPEVSREDMPGYGPIDFHLSRQKNHGPGPKFLNPDYLDVIVTGPVPELLLTAEERAKKWRALNVELPPEGTGKILLGKRKIGALRLTTNGGTLYPEHPSSVSRPRSIALLKNQSLDAVRRVASVISSRLFGQVAETHPKVAVCCRNMQRWLVEDGLAEQFLLDLRKASIDYKTVKSVITD